MSSIKAITNWVAIITLISVQIFTTTAIIPKVNHTLLSMIFNFILAFIVSMILFNIQCKEQNVTINESKIAGFSVLIGFCSCILYLSRAIFPYVIDVPIVDVGV